MGVFFSLTSGDGILLGLGTGAFFGIGMAAATAAFQKRLERDPPVFDREEVLLQSPANHFRGVEGVGGWLMLTDQRLVFQPHSLNVQKAEWSVPLSELIRVEPRRTLGILPNGLRAVTTAGEERFVVEDRTPWLREVELAKGEGLKG
jgi:hypothetical protein